MKIKCPICDEDLDTESLENTKTHLWHSISSIVKHAEQTFKIHEKIEFHEQEAFEEYFGVDVAKELKSLLENDEK